MKNSNLVIGIILLIFFVISFMQNILGPIIPDIIEDFGLSLTMAGFLPFSFFIAYGVMSIPTGFLLEKYKAGNIMIAAFSVSLVGALLFALKASYAYALLSLFLIGLGMAMLQVSINPLLRVAGGEKHFAFNSVLAQLIFGLASFISPNLYVYLVRNLQESSASHGFIKFFKLLTPENLPWVSLYWVFVVVIVLMIFIIVIIKIPQVELKEDERVGSKKNISELFKSRIVILYFIGIIAYVGTEQGVANWISKFLANYHHFDPQSSGAKTVAGFWGLMTVGCLVGLFLLKILDSRKVLILFSSFAIVSLTFALFGSGKVALIAFPLVGFFASVMWSVIFSLALNSVDKHHGAFSGILCTGILGGALVPVIIGGLGTIIGLRFGMLFLYITLGYIFSIGFWAKPLITNETTSGKQRIVRLLGKFSK